MKTLLGAVTLSLLAWGAAPVNAAGTFTIVPGKYSSQGAPNTGTNTANSYASDYQGNVPAGASFSVNPYVSGGSFGGQFKSPFANTTDEDNFSYFSVGGGFDAPQGTATTPVSLSLASGYASAATILWGSIDSYNKLEFLRDGDIVETFFGADIEYNGTNFEKVAVVLFNGFTSGVSSLLLGFNEVRFSSTQQAFEFGISNASLTPLGAVPIPAALPLFGTALGGLFFLKRRQRRNSASI